MIVSNPFILNQINYVYTIVRKIQQMIQQLYKITGLQALKIISIDYLVKFLLIFRVLLKKQKYDN